MTTEDAIQTLEDGDWWYWMGDIPVDTPCHKMFHGALDMAISALRERRVEENKPLTLEELHSSFGEIVYCTLNNDWCRVSPCGLLFFGTANYKDWDYIEKTYGEIWAAYRRPQAANGVMNMTIEEAIGVLRDVELYQTGIKGKVEACEMAIAALRAQQEAEKIKPQIGLYGKYIVRKSDSGEHIYNCFVLRPDRDKAAIVALRAYAKATDNEMLADDIMNWVGSEKNDPLTIEELREMGGQPYYHVSLQNGKPHWVILDSLIAKHIEDHYYGERWLAYRRPPEKDDAP